MGEEIQALENNGTWTLENLPPGEKTIGCKWVYKIKYHSDGSIEHHKARLWYWGIIKRKGSITMKLFPQWQKLLRFASSLL